MKPTTAQFGFRRAEDAMKSDFRHGPTADAAPKSTHRRPAAGWDTPPRPGSPCVYVDSTISTIVVDVFPRATPLTDMEFKFNGKAWCLLTLRTFGWLLMRSYAIQALRAQGKITDGQYAAFTERWDAAVARIWDLGMYDKETLEWAHATEAEAESFIAPFSAAKRKLGLNR